MKKLNKQDYKTIMAKLYIDRMENDKEMENEQRYSRDFSLIKSTHPDMNDEDVEKLAMNFTAMNNYSEFAKNVMILSQNSKKYEVVKFAREDDLNDLYLAKKEIEKLIKQIQAEHKDYLVFYE
ncbi:hypothetical protein [Staphylococcus hsinchuensis]|uniref:Phage protein n=1 Tax=Staphylococcus hsinchuensis TaxID=3051183 RepID=A0ABZ3ED88_9STAP